MSVAGEGSAAKSYAGVLKLKFIWASLLVLEAH